MNCHETGCSRRIRRTNRIFLPLILSLTLACVPVRAQEAGNAAGTERKHIPISVEDILRLNGSSPDQGAPDLNERLRSMAAATRYSQDYVLGPGDIVELTVFGIDELKQKSLALDARGRVYLPFINEVQLLGLTPRESEVKIATLYEASVLKNPQVSLAVKEYRSQFVNVLGAVVHPGSYQLVRRVFLIDGLAMAGGLLAEKAGFKAYVHRAAAAGRNPGGPPDQQTFEIDLVRLLEKGDVSLNVPLEAGDVVTVPEREERFYYVLGDVQRGGAFGIKRGETVTLSKALASAGGFLSTAKAAKTVIMRNGRTDTAATPIPVNVPRILKGRDPDPILSQDDVVFVPGSTTKSVGRGVLSGISGVLAALVYAGVRR
jgi:polysaccharide export outer membrane protein